MTYGEKLTMWKQGGGSAVVITKGTHAWDQWMLYFHQFGVRFVLDILAGDARRSWTVPSDDPLTFDMDFSPDRGRRAMAAAAARFERVAL